MRVNLQVFGPRPLPQISAEGDLILPERDFPAASAAERPVAPFGSGLRGLGRRNGTGGASGRPSRRAYPANRRNLPLCLPRIQFALAPVPAPSAADQMLFAPTGRTVRTAAVRDLPANFPACSRLTCSHSLKRRFCRRTKCGMRCCGRGFRLRLCGRGKTNRKLNAPKRGAENRRGLCPDGDGFRFRCGRGNGSGRENNDMAGGGPPAEAVGVLLRVSDGAILWRDRAAVTCQAALTAPVHSPRLRQEQAVARDAQNSPCWICSAASIATSLGLRIEE